jgi:hypothetical protein
MAQQGRWCISRCGHSAIVDPRGNQLPRNSCSTGVGGCICWRERQGQLAQGHLLARYCCRRICNSSNRSCSSKLLSLAASMCQLCSKYATMQRAWLQQLVRVWH